MSVLQNGPAEVEEIEKQGKSSSDWEQVKCSN